MDIALTSRIKNLSAESKIKALRAVYANDCKLFFKNLVFTLNEHSGTANAIQKMPDWQYIYNLVDDLVKYRWLFILKSRQVMASWVMCAYLLWVILFHKGKKVALQSKKGDDSNSLIERMRVIYDHLPSWKPQADFSYCRIKVPEMYSDAYGIPQGADQIRSFTFSCIFSDEFGFQEQLEDTFTAAKPAVDGGGQFVAITTPPKKKNFAFKCLRNPVFQEPIGKVVKIHYSQRPDRDMKWMLEAKKGYGSESSWNREQELMFLEAGDRRIYDPFKETLHVNPGLIYQPGKIVLRGFDFGFHRPACSWSQIDDQDRWNDLYEILGHNEELEIFVPKVIKESNLRFPDAQFIDYADYAGNQKSDKNKKTSIQILQDFTKQFVTSRPNLNIEDGHSVVRKKMITIIEDRPAFQIHPICMNSIDGFLFGYLYKADGESIYSDYKDDEGETEKEYYKHLQDCRRYKMQNIYTNKGQKINQEMKMNARQTKQVIPLLERMNARKPNNSDWMKVK